MSNKTLGLNKPSSENRSGRPTRLRTLEDSQNAGKLNVDGKDDEYHYYVENDEKGKIQAREKLGFEVVEKSSGVTMGDANPKEVGSRIETTVFSDGTKGVLMRQRKEWYEEDEKFKADRISKREEALFRKQEEGQYGEIKVE